MTNWISTRTWIKTCRLSPPRKYAKTTVLDTEMKSADAGGKEAATAETIVEDVAASAANKAAVRKRAEMYHHHLAGTIPRRPDEMIRRHRDVKSLAVKNRGEKICAVEMSVPPHLAAVIAPRVVKSRVVKLRVERNLVQKSLISI